MTIGVSRVVIFKGLSHSFEIINKTSKTCLKEMLTTTAILLTVAASSKVYRLRSTFQLRKLNVDGWIWRLSWSCHFQWWIDISSNYSQHLIMRTCGGQKFPTKVVGYSCKQTNPKPIVFRAIQPESLRAFIFRWNKLYRCFLSWYTKTMALSSTAPRWRINVRTSFGRKIVLRLIGVLSTVLDCLNGRTAGLASTGRMAGLLSHGLLFHPN